MSDRVARKGFDDAKVQEHLAEEAIVIRELRAVAEAFEAAHLRAEAALKMRMWQLDNFREQFTEPTPTPSTEPTTEGEMST